MKRNLYICLFPLFLVCCSFVGVQAKKAPKPNKSDIENIIKDLWKGIPDHGLNEFTETSLTPEFYMLVDMGFSVPSDNPTGIGTEEFLYFWYNETDNGEDDHIVSIEVLDVTPDTIKAQVIYQYFDELVPHSLKLAKSNEKWLIDDFDEMRQEIYEYVRTTGVQFLGDYATEIIELPHVGGDMTDDEKEEYFEEVEAFRAKFNAAYPDGTVKK